MRTEEHVAVAEATSGYAMLDWLGQAITYGLLRVILPLLMIVGLTALATAPGDPGCERD